MAGKKNTDIHIRILQNGFPVADYTKAISKHLNIDLTANYMGDLTLPLYPISGNINLFTTEKGQLLLNLDQPWSGFITTSGQVRNILESDREARQFPLIVGDYGSVCWRDLRLLYRIDARKPEPKSTQSKAKGYNGLPLGLLLPNSSDWRYFSAALMMGFLIVGITCYSMLTAKVHRPAALEDLGTAYTLPFIGPEHIRLIPETMQTKLDRGNYLQSTIGYYRALSATLSGWFVGKQSEYLRDATVSRHNALHENYRARLKEEVGKQADLNDRVSQDQTAALLFIPSVIGESARQRLLRMLGKIEVFQEGQRLNLLFKRRISKQFGRDEGYDWLDYHSAASTNHSAQEYLSKIRVFGDLTNEQQMYAAADKLAQEAETLQKHKFGKLVTSLNSTIKDEAYIRIDSGINFASFMSSAQMLANSEKIGQIRASSFDRQRKDVIKEPLVGIIDPGAIQKALSRNQFQLQLCYELALRRNQLAQGSMDWQWRIDSRGKISDIVLKQSSVGDRRMVECVRNKMAMWQFPRPRNGSIEINHSFQFSPQKG